MHKRHLQLYIGKREALERTFERAKFFFMMVESCVQAASGLLSLSSYVASYSFLEVNIDEAHQRKEDELVHG